MVSERDGTDSRKRVGADRRWQARHHEDCVWEFVSIRHAFEIGIGERECLIIAASIRTLGFESGKGEHSTRKMPRAAAFLAQIDPFAAQGG